jgi:hypothetical protein
VQKYKEANPDSGKAARASWKANNKRRINLYTALRRKRIREASPKSLTEFDHLFIAEIYDLAQRRGLEVDHIIPLKHPLVCGLHVPENLQLLTKHENCVKASFFGEAQ